MKSMVFRRCPAVLVTACGAKVPLLRAFRAACHVRGVRLFASDLDTDAPALVEADGVITLPPWRDPNWSAVLLAQCRAQGVGLLVSTADCEWPLLLPVRSLLAQAGVVLPGPVDEAGWRLCHDKRSFTRWCAANGFGVAPELDSRVDPAGFPVFARAPVGQGGATAWRVESRRMLEALLELHPGLLIQPLIEAPEYSVDVLMDMDARPLQAVVRRRLAVRGGEAWTSQVEAVPELAEQAMALCSGLRLSGHCVVQAFWSQSEGTRFIEVNPRFGGASSLAIRAGAGFTRALAGPGSWR